MADLFERVVAEEKLNPLFRALLEPGHDPARETLQDAFERLPNPDGNFRHDFQSTGFDARIWELYLCAYATASGLKVDRPHGSPDFLFERNDLGVWVEAVTANPTQGDAMPEEEPDREKDSEALREWMNNAIPIKLGSTLTSKLKKEYWTLPHVRGQVFVLAIADFHDPSPWRNSEHSLDRYLYGVDGVVSSAAGESVRVTHFSVAEHRKGSKIIPSGFFSLPGSENISAVLFSNSATVPKFNRMGYDAARFPYIRMIRSGVCHDYRETAVLPKAFAYKVGTQAEDWGEGLSVFHNPMALRELPFEFFPDLSQHWLDAAGFHPMLRPFHPYASITEVYATERQGSLAALDESIPTRVKNLTAALDEIAAGTRRSPAIRSVTRAEFDAYGPARGPLVGVVWEEVEWFADGNGTVLGVLTHDFGDDDWGYAVLGRDTNGTFRAIMCATSILDRDDARNQLVSEVKKALAGGETVFPQGDEDG